MKVYVCIKDFFMSESCGGELSFSKGKVYVFHKKSQEEEPYMARHYDYWAKDNSNTIHYMRKKDLDEYFIKVTTSAAKLLYENK